MNIYIQVNSLQEAKLEMARIQRIAEQAGAKILTLTPSGPWGTYESEDEILTAIESTGTDPTTCVKGTVDKHIDIPL